MIPKFRFWHREKGCFVDDSLYLDSLGNVYRDVTVDFFEPKAIENPIRPIKNIEVMQSTGMFDKNGVEIFDRDVVRFGNSIDVNFVVKWSKDKAGFALYKKYGDYVRLLSDFSTYTVIGNIHQHPFLLEEL